MGLAPISAKLVGTRLVLNQTGQIQTEICAALGRLPVRTVFSNFCCYNWNSGAEYFSSQLFVIPQGHFTRFTTFCRTLLCFCSPRSRCTEFPQSWRSRKITDFSSHLFAQVAQTVANKRTMAKNGRGYHYTWCSPMPGTMVGTMEEINHPLVTVAPSVTCNLNQLCVSSQPYRDWKTSRLPDTLERYALMMLGNLLEEWNCWHQTLCLVATSQCFFKGHAVIKRV